MATEDRPSMQDSADRPESKADSAAGGALMLVMGLVGFLIMVVVLGGVAFIVLRSLLGAQGSAPLAGTWGKLLAVVFLLTVFLYLFSFIVPRRK